MTRCPYCKIDFECERWAKPTRNIVCANCRNYYDVTQRLDELALLEHYKCWPVNWHAFDEWRNDPQYLKKEGETNVSL